MGVTNPNYPTMEIALCMVNAPDTADNERMKIGDIIAIRKPGSFIGTQEGKIFLWLQIDGPEANEFAVFTQQVFEPTDPEIGAVGDGGGFRSGWDGAQGPSDGGGRRKYRQGVRPRDGPRSE